jgi:hypothetical protein
MHHASLLDRPAGTNGESAGSWFKHDVPHHNEHLMVSYHYQRQRHVGVDLD